MFGAQLVNATELPVHVTRKYTNDGQRIKRVRSLYSSQKVWKEGVKIWYQLQH